MNSSERRARIRANLGIEPISHGQVYTFQIAIPESEKENISLERSQLIEDTLIQHKSNLIPLIVRRTDKYSEEEEYEVVYGADWCIVAKQLDIEKLWAWVFDMNDEQAAAAKEEMQQLLGFSNSTPVVLASNSEETQATEIIITQINKLVTQIDVLNKKVERVSTSSLQKFKSSESQDTDIYQKVETLAEKIEQIATSVKQLQQTQSQTQSQQANTDSPLVMQFTEAVNKILKEVLSKPGSSMTKNQLLELARNQGLKVTTRMTKADIINILEKANISQ